MGANTGFFTNTGRIGQRPMSASGHSRLFRDVRDMSG